MITHWRRARGLTRVVATLALTLTSTAHVLAAEEGTFPTADQIGGSVFPEGLKAGQPFPTDIKLFDESGKERMLSDVITGKRTLLVFFISAAPVSVAELEKIDKFAAGNKSGTQVIFANADTVGVALMGTKPIPETVRTINMLKKDNNLTSPVFVAPNNVFDPSGISNRLGFRGLPTSYLIGKDGKLEKQFVGPHDWKAGDL